MRNGKANPKNYPYWKTVVEKLKQKDIRIIQIGREGEPIVEGIDTRIIDSPLEELERLINKSDTWIAVDNFLQHLITSKPGVVIWSLSDPLIFGYPQNTNILISRGWLKPRQFDIWEVEQFNPKAFPKPDQVVEEVLKLVKKG
jgi:ADP-heptose:LPS heptosyltransferase